MEGNCQGKLVPAGLLVGVVEGGGKKRKKRIRTSHTLKETRAGDGKKLSLSLQKKLSRCAEPALSLCQPL